MYHNEYDLNVIVLRGVGVRAIKGTPNHGFQNINPIPIENERLLNYL